MLILAGVSISFLIGYNGVINKSQSAVNEYEEASKKEQELLEQIDNYLGQELSIVDNNGLAKKNTTIVAKDDPNIQIVIPEGFAPAILMTGTTQSLPGENGAVKGIMPVEEWNNITKDDINRGIVVVDHAITYDGGQTTGTVPDFNEYVWIPMPDSSKFTKNNWERENSLSETSKEDVYWEETSSKEYIDMVDSVNRYKGFYISRYEASEKNSTTAQSKRGQNPWVYVSLPTATTVSSNMNASINSHLIYGVEWDSVLQWLLDSGAKIGSNTSGEEPRSITLEDIRSDSRSWGNYNNSIGDSADNAGDAAKSGGINEYWKVNNIYDLAGNVWEWTKEKYSTSNRWTDRGGSYKFKGEDIPVAHRDNDPDNSMRDDERF